MKIWIITIVMGLSLLGCQKDNKPSGGDPRIYNINFQLLRGDGSSHKNGDVEINGFLLTMENGQLQLGDGFDWYGMGRINTQETQTSGKILYGGPCLAPNCVTDYVSAPFASGAEGDTIEQNEIWEKDKYLLLRYANEDIDTLRVHDIRTENPYNRTFTFFINGQETEATNFIYDEYAITIQK